MSIDNTGRNIYLHEILIDFLKNTEEYSDENIKKKLQTYYLLQKKYNENPNNLERYDRLELKRLKAFFSKTFQISFNSSNLVYPRFKEAYLIAKAAIANIKTAYDNIISDYYEIANRGYYEYKDAKYLEYLEYIKKKIILAKVDAGLIDYDGIPKEQNYNRSTENNSSNYTDSNKKPELENPLKKQDIAAIPSSSNSNYSSSPSSSLSSSRRPSLTPLKSFKKEDDANIKSKPIDEKNKPQIKSATKNAKKIEQLPVVKPQPAAKPPEDKPEDKQVKEVKEVKPDVVDKNNSIKGILKLNSLHPPPPPIFDVKNIEESIKGIPNLGKYLLPPPPLYIGGNDIKIPKTIDEQYKDEQVYIEKLLLDYEDFNYINKNIEELYTKLKELNNFIYGEDNGKNSLKSILEQSKESRDDNTESILFQITNTKLDIQKYIDSKNIETLLKDITSDDTNKKIKKFMEEKIPDLFKKDKEVYIDKMKDIKINIYGENGSEKIDTSLKNIINNIKELYNEYISTLKSYLLKFKSKEEDLKDKLKKIHAIDLENAKAKAKDTYYPQQHRGGDGVVDPDAKKYKDKLDDLSNKKTIDTKIKSLGESFNEIKNKINIKNKDPMVKISLNNSGSSDGISLFDKIWKNYTNDMKDDKKLIEKTEDKFYNNVKSNDLDPAVVLELTIEDRLIFVVISYFLRQFSLGIVEYFIDNGNIKDIIYSLVFYVICYILMIILLIIIVNLDSYKLRIIFNYLNFHINSSNIYLHIFVVCIFTFLIYSLILNINFPIQNINQPYISESDKLKLSYRLDILTMIIYLFSTTIVLLI